MFIRWVFVCQARNVNACTVSMMYAIICQACSFSNSLSFHCTDCCVFAMDVYKIFRTENCYFELYMTLFIFRSLQLMHQACKTVAHTNYSHLFFLCSTLSSPQNLLVAYIYILVGLLFRSVEVGLARKKRKKMNCDDRQNDVITPIHQFPLTRYFFSTPMKCFISHWCLNYGDLNSIFFNCSRFLCVWAWEPDLSI